MKKIGECNGSITTIITDLLILAVVYLQLFNLTVQDYAVGFIPSVIF
jgi:hypothetical protein